MIRHNVLFILKTTANQSDIDRAFDLLAKLKTQLPGFIRAAWGECIFHFEDLQNKRIYGFSIDFEDEDAYKAFLENRVGDAAKNSILHIAEGEINGIYGFDMGKYQGSAPGINPLDKYRMPTPRLVPPGAKWT